MIDTNNNLSAEEGRPTTLTYFKNILHIGTHNIKGFNSIGKQIHFFTQYDIDYNLDIIGLTETKTKKSEEKIWSKTQKKKLGKKKKKKLKKKKKKKKKRIMEMLFQVLIEILIIFILPGGQVKK